MIAYFLKTESDFTHNGLGVLDDYIINPVVTEELNGLFRLEFDYPTHAPHGEGLIPERIVRCPVPDMDDQLFRISERESSIGGIFHVVAYHVFYDLAQNLIEDTNVVNKNGQQAIQQILGAGQFTHPFTGSSNIAAINTARLVRHSIAEVLLDGGLDNGFFSRWGGEIIRDNFHIYMQTVRGSDNGVCIRDKKNLTGYRSDVDFGTVVTRIMPQGFDGLLLPEKYVDSPFIGNYLTPRIRVFKYEKVKAAVGDRAADEDAVPLSEAYALLRTLAAKEYSENRIDLPAATYDVEFAPLERTEEYKDFTALETIAIGDTVKVVHEEDGFDITARMVSYKYDPLVKSYISVTLGSYTPKFTDVAREIKRMDVSVQQAVDDANYALQSANGKNSNYYGHVQPANPRKGDVWFKENGDKLEMWIYETREGVTQWFPLMTDLTQEEIRQELAEAAAMVEEALEKSGEAMEAGEAAQAAGQEALAAGQAAQNAANQAATAAQGAVTTANQAFDNAVSVLATASKAVNDLAGATVLQTPWQQGTLSNSTGAESNSTSYVRSGWFDVAAGKKYLLQTYGGASAYSLYSTAYLFYYREDKTFLSYTTNGNTAAPFTVPANARYLRVRYTTTAAPATINCYLLQTETSNGYVDLNTLTSMVKLQATTDTLMVTVGETSAAIGTPFKVQQWESGTLNTTTGVESASSSYLRSGYIDVNPGEKYIAQLRDGSSVTMAYFYYKPNMPYAEFTVSAPRQYSEAIAAGTYDNSTVISYLNGKNVESMNITGAVSTNPYTSSGDYLVIYRLPLEGRDPPNTVKWNGRKDSSDNIVLLYTGNTWVQIGTVTTTSYTVHEWTITDAQRRGIIGDFIHLAFFSIKTGSYAGIYSNGTTPFGIALTSDVCFLSYSSTSGTVTIPANCTKMRVRATSTISPDEYTGNVYTGTVRQDYSKGDTLYSALLMQKDVINLRVSKNDVINQINVSTEGILIAGNKVRITGTTTIDNAVIQTAMIANLAVTTAKIADLSVSTAKIADVAITNAKIANLDAGKINTGTLSADRIAAGSITSAKLTVANGFITNAMISDATIQSAKIAAIDAAKITTGTLSATRIGANSITADKLATNAIQVGLAGWTSSIRITPYDISWYNGSTLSGKIDASGMSFYYGSRFIGSMGESYDSGNSSRRGISVHLNGEGDFVTWAYRTGTSGTFNRYLTFDPKGVVSNGAGIHLGTSLRTNGYDFYTSGNRSVYLTDNSLSGAGTFPAWSSSNGNAKVTFGSSHLYFVTNGTYYTCTNIVARIGELISRMNEIIRRLNYGWVISASGSTSTWPNSGYSSMSTTL